MGKENNILKRVDKRNPFLVPDDYFRNFAQVLMNNLPEKDSILTMSEPTLWQRVKPWLYMTAMFVGIMLTVRIFVKEPPKEEFPITQVEAENLSNEEWEIMMRHTLINDYAMYEYLTEVENND